jgi:S-DNA-T family DNA segregation ATPase FtsK/SpoIIIE
MAAYMITYGKPWLVVLGISFVLISVGVTFAVRWQLRSNNRNARDLYDEYLTEIRRKANGIAAQQRHAAAFTRPSPERLWAIAAGVDR